MQSHDVAERAEAAQFDTGNKKLDYLLSNTFHLAEGGMDNAMLWYESLTDYLASRDGVQPGPAVKAPTLTAGQRYDREMKDAHLASPLERLKFFCTLAMNEQDRLDAAVFFEDLEEEIALCDGVCQDAQRYGDIRRAVLTPGEHLLWTELCDITSQMTDLSNGEFDRRLDRVRAEQQEDYT